MVKKKNLVVYNSHYPPPHAGGGDAWYLFGYKWIHTFAYHTKKIKQIYCLCASPLAGYFSAVFNTKLFIYN